MLFEWDEDKREKNLWERNIDFRDAALVWLDPRRQEREDARKDYGETRMQTIGQANFNIYLVVYTERIRDGDQEVVRIISMRKASAKERAQYENYTFMLGDVS